MMLEISPPTMTSEMERMAGYGRILFKNLPAKAGDILIMHSVSGRNAVTIDMAEAAREAGLRVIVLTNMTTATSVPSRHPSGKNLYEVCDIVIDNCGVTGDAAIKLEGLEEKIGPTSTTVGTAILNAIVIEAVEQMISDGIVPPVFMSANIDGGDAHNARIFEEYKDNIFYM
jgi:uncharacterized phosphosugar-binding protein